ncbi:hypothetical protein [Microcella sp.]|uniref:hypothetical protein n=1 Tax=Microcella sp. TaxID=1913979 RepID=UPI0039194A95
MSFLDDLQAEIAKPAPTLDVDVVLNGNKHTLQFRRLDGLTWAELIDRHPPRIGGKDENDVEIPPVWVDVRYGYNLRAVILDAAPLCGSVPDGAELSASDWADLLNALDGAAFQRVSDAIFQLNEVGPREEVDAARKAPKRSRRSSTSPSSLE